MPTIERNGATLHFSERGTGPAIFLQHALSADSRSWDAIGVADTLVARGFRVILPDALGHGRSSVAPTDRVDLANRVDDLLAVADALKVESFHYAGYSMGGWLGIGLLRAASQRLLSLSVAGWDPIDGARRFTQLSDMAERRDEFDDRIRALTADLPPHAQPDALRLAGYADTYERLFKDLPSITTLLEADVPLMLAVGRDDPYLEPVAAAAEALGIEFASLAGDHVTAFLAPEYAATLARWHSAQRGSRLPVAP